MKHKSRRKKILLGIFIPTMVICVGFGITFLTIYWPIVWNQEPPVIGFPLSDSDDVVRIWGFGNHDGEWHGGIDFICNSSVEIVAWCKLRVNHVVMFQNEVNGFWQTNVYFQYSWKYKFEALFESLTENETEAKIQREAIPVKFGQIFEPGETIGTLINFGMETVLHFGVKEYVEDVCAYQYFTSSAKTTFLDLWNANGYGDGSWYTG